MKRGRKTLQPWVLSLPLFRVLLSLFRRSLLKRNDFFYPCKMTPFIERCISSTKPNGRLSVLIINKFSLWFTLGLSSASTCPKWPLFQVYHLFLTENFPLSPAKQRKSYIFTDPTETEMIKEWPRKLSYDAYVVSWPCQKIQHISLQSNVIYFLTFSLTQRKKIYW